MAHKNYTEEFRRQAVDFYESTPGATGRGIAEELGIERGTLRHWLERYGTGKKKAADGTLTRSPLQARQLQAGNVVDETPEQRAARLQSSVAQLEGQNAKLTTERGILRSAATYFAGTRQTFRPRHPRRPAAVLDALHCPEVTHYANEPTQAQQSPTADTMRMLLDALEAHHGGVHGWLKEQGWTQADTDRMRSKLLD